MDHSISCSRCGDVVEEYHFGMCIDCQALSIGVSKKDAEACILQAWGEALDEIDFYLFSQVDWQAQLKERLEAYKFWIEERTEKCLNKD